MSHALSTAVTRLFDVMMAPFGTHGEVALSVISLLAGVAMILIFKVTSDQVKVRRIRELANARILEMRIYHDDLGVMLRALGAALWTNVAYLRQNLRSMLVLGALAAVVFVQLDARFARSPLRPGHAAMVTATYPSDVDVMATPLAIEAGEGVAVDSPPVRVPARHEASWRVRVLRAGVPALTLSVNGKSYRLNLAASPGTDVVGRGRSKSALDVWVRPGLPPLTRETPIASVAIVYPRAEHTLLWGRAGWLAVFLFWSLVGVVLGKVCFNIRL